MEAKKKEEDERNEVLYKEGLLVIIRVMLKNNADTCFDKGYYTSEEREIYHEMFEVYEELGGNGVIADLGERLRRLPYEPEDK